jgi:hypothetical protein
MDIIDNGDCIPTVYKSLHAINKTAAEKFRLLLT